MSSSYTPGGAFTKSFQLLQNAFLQSEGLPFADVLSEEEIREAFVAANACFAQDEDDIYTPAVTLWAWLSQTLHAGALRSCAAAVARVGVLCVMLNRQPPSPDTGDYCRARAKLPERVLEQLLYRVGEALESRVPADWLWQGRHVKIADGTTLLTPDTPLNQHAWPQARTQKRGVGFPILRMVVLLSLATAALCGMAVGPYKGKQTGEPALLRELLDRLQAGDVFGRLLLLLLLSAGVVAGLRRGFSGASTPAAADRLSPRRAAGAQGSCSCFGSGPPVRHGWTKKPTRGFRQRSACANWKCACRSAAFACGDSCWRPR